MLSNHTIFAKFNYGFHLIKDHFLYMHTIKYRFSLLKGKTIEEFLDSGFVVQNEVDASYVEKYNRAVSVGRVKYHRPRLK